MKRLVFVGGVLAVVVLGYNGYHWFDGLTQNRIGYLLFKFKKDEAAAFRWFQRSAEKGNSKGMLNLGHCYLCGHGTEQNHERARFWLTRSDQPEAKTFLTKLDPGPEAPFVFRETIPAGTRSSGGSAESRVVVRILNGTDRFLDFRWIDFEGNLDLVRRDTSWGHISIGPGNVWAQQTYVGHPFAIVDPLRGKVLGSFVFQKKGEYRLEIRESGGRRSLTEATPPPTSAGKNPFGVRDVGEIPDDQIRQLASQANLPGHREDPNAPSWCGERKTGTSFPSVEGAWSSRWNHGTAEADWRQGTAQIKSSGEKIYILYEDDGKYLVEAKIDKNLLLGKYVNLNNGRDTGPWVGKIVGNDRIDGQWAHGRWDFRR